MDAKTEHRFLADGPAPARREPRPRPSPGRRARPDPAVVAAALVVGVILAWALAPGWIAPYPATRMDPGAILAPPGGAHLLGTDHFGRDVLSLVIYGARQSLLVGAGAVAVGVLVGGLIGVIAGYVGRAVDLVVMRLIEVWLSIPGLLLVIVVTTALRPSLGAVILTIGVVSAPHYARVMRAQVMSIRGRPFVEASRAIGTSHLAILTRHILPHTISPMLVLATLGVGSAILTGAALSFIGLGVVDDRPDWGFLLSQGRSYLTVAWWFGTFPGLAITALVISINRLGEALRMSLDPRSRTA